MFRLIVIVILRETVGTNEAFDARTYRLLYLVSDKSQNVISVFDSTYLLKLG